MIPRSQEVWAPVYGIAENQDGYISLGTSCGLDRLDPKTGVFTHFRHEENNARSWTHGITKRNEIRDGE
jgi:hypothetical protein